MSENKVKYGLKNVFYSMLTYNTSNVAQYATPVAIPGAVSLNLDAEGERTSFYADDVEYFVVNENNGYTGSLEVARIPDSFRKDVLGDIEDGKGVLLEDQNAEIKHFALLFEFNGDVNAIKHVLYNCTASRPSETGQTKGENIEVQTESIDLSAKSVYFDSVAKYIVKGKTNASTDATTLSTWYATVHTPVAPV